jgi:hypothetical protein
LIFDEFPAGFSAKEFYGANIWIYGLDTSQLSTVQDIDNYNSLTPFQLRIQLDIISPEVDFSLEKLANSSDIQIRRHFRNKSNT